MNNYSANVGIILGVLFLENQRKRFLNLVIYEINSNTAISVHISFVNRNKMRVKLLSVVLASTYTAINKND